MLAGKIGLSLDDTLSKLRFYILNLIHEKSSQTFTEEFILSCLRRVALALME